MSRTILLCNRQFRVWIVPVIARRLKVFLLKKDKSLLKKRHNEPLGWEWFAWFLKFSTNSQKKKLENVANFFDFIQNLSFYWKVRVGWSIDQIINRKISRRVSQRFKILRFLFFCHLNLNTNNYPHGKPEEHCYLHLYVGIDNITKNKGFYLYNLFSALVFISLLCSERYLTLSEKLCNPFK